MLKKSNINDRAIAEIVPKGDSISTILPLINDKRSNLPNLIRDKLALLINYSTNSFCCNCLEIYKFYHLYISSMTIF